MPATSKILLGSALLLAAVPIFASEETAGSVAPVATPSARVKCPGVTYIPFTADAEQSLPLQVVGSLGCGEVVSVLSDNEGYTMHIRTRDGKDGYVARMFLAENEAPAAGPAMPDLQRHTSATPVNGVVRWSAGAPGCDQFVSRGRYVESATANGITVQVSVQDTGWKYRVNVAVANESHSNVDLTPGIITLDELQPRLRTLPAADTKAIAGTSTHQVLWTLTDAMPSPSATETRDSQQARFATPNRNFSTPDYMNPQLTLTSAKPGAFDRTENIDIQSIALKYASLTEGQNTAGVMWFARDPGARELSLRVPAGDVVFDFSFAFEQKQ